jgi:hypothetical protein
MEGVPAQGVDHLRDGEGNDKVRAGGRGGGYLLDIKSELPLVC